VLVSVSREGSRAFTPHTPREDGLAHPADPSRPNLADVLPLLPRRLSKPFALTRAHLHGHIGAVLHDGLPRVHHALHSAGVWAGARAPASQNFSEFRDLSWEHVYCMRGEGGVAHMLRSTIAQFLATACREGCGRFNTRQRRKIASRNGRDFGWEMAQAAVSRRPPTLSRSVARTHLYTTREFGVCPSFKGHFPSRRANLTLRFATFASLYGGVS
jgi:hypothetical protein